MCADILGSNKVIAVSMPTKYTSQLSKDIIASVVKNLGIKLIEIPIDDILNNYEANTKNILNLNTNAVGENLQARIRGNLLMALSNQYPKFMVLTTGNKSEIATGYSTLYGDSCGAFNLLKDLYKTQVFSLAKYLNVSIAWFSQLQKFNLIPKKAISRKPSAELKDNQFDEDNLMEYNILDKIIYDVVEKNLSLEKLYDKYNHDNVNKVLKLLKNSQHKRVQSATGIKLSSRSFSFKEYQYPIASAYKINR
jgi:NAD+ synthetase